MTQETELLEYGECRRPGQFRVERGPAESTEGGAVDNAAKRASDLLTGFLEAEGYEVIHQPVETDLPQQWGGAGGPAELTEGGAMGETTVTAKVALQRLADVDLLGERVAERRLPLRVWGWDGEFIAEIGDVEVKGKNIWHVLVALAEELRHAE